jgi:hypothetical protein
VANAPARQPNRAPADACQLPPQPQAPPAAAAPPHRALRRVVGPLVLLVIVVVHHLVALVALLLLLVLKLHRDADLLVQRVAGDGLALAGRDPVVDQLADCHQLRKALVRDLRRREGVRAGGEGASGVRQHAWRANARLLSPWIRPWRPLRRRLRAAGSTAAAHRAQQLVDLLLARGVGHVLVLQHSQHLGGRHKGQVGGKCAGAACHDPLNPFHHVTWLHSAGQAKGAHLVGRAAQHVLRLVPKLRVDDVEHGLIGGAAGARGQGEERAAWRRRPASKWGPLQPPAVPPPCTPRSAATATQASATPTAARMLPLLLRLPPAPRAHRVSLVRGR